MRQLDSLIFNALNGLAGKSPVFDAFAVFSASALIWIIGASVLVPVWRARGNHREHVAAAVTASRAASAALLGVFGNLLVSLAYFRPRPFVMMAEATPLIGIMPASKSFPSDHATIAFAVAASVFMRSPG
ncbi:hypothetical protein HY633_02990, partial [Candidatus Uhrbacteria bacterium]|nr:hypothetical protein [Candidatus Uhrbacteria bacterium]